MIRNVRFAVVYILLVIVGLYIHLHSDVTVPMNKAFSEFPRSCRTWRMVSESAFTEDIIRVLKPTEYISRQYAGPDGRSVNLYIGYHGGTKESGGIHSPRHCLPGSGWYEVSTERTELDAPAGKINLVKAVYQKGDSRELFLYWFQVRGKTLSDEYSLKAAEIANSMVYRRRDSAFVRISVPFEADEERAATMGVQFIRDFFPLIREYLPG